MRRHILLPRLLRNQPLVTYIARRQTLATALGLRQVHSTSGDTPASRAAQPWWPLPADRQSRPARELVIDRSEEKALVGQTAGARQEFAHPAMYTAHQEESREPDVQREHTSESQMDLAESEEIRTAFQPIEPAEIENTLGPIDLEEDETALQPGEPAQDVTDVPSRSLAEPRSGGAEQANAQPASLREKPEEPVRRDPSRRRVRPSIAEISTGNEKLPPISPARGSEPDAGRERILSAPANAPVEQSTSELIAEESQRGEPAAEELFAPRGTDRSPQAWLARLTRQAQRERQAALSPAPAPRVRQAAAHMAEPIVPESPVPRVAEPIAQSARTFLKPLLGLDPAGVPVYRDRQAEDATAGERADALSDGEAVELAPGHREETPETLGLLAHELTHVARQQRPRFIPPILRWVAPTPAWETRDEEAVALQVERQVRQVARGEPPVSVPVAPHRAASEPVQGAAEEIAPRAERGIWGNLPAPWEPLPEWLAGPSVPGTQSASIQLASSLAGTQDAGIQPARSLPAGVPSAPSFVAGADGGAEESGKRRAGVERGVEEPGPGETSTPQDNQPTSDSPRAPEPDLDALARQVYSLLKRRLSVEQRREM